MKDLIMSRFLACIGAVVFCLSSLHAQTDSTFIDDEEQTGPRRKPNGEAMLGITYANLSYTSKVYDQYGQIVGDTNVADNRLYASFGYGGHIPLFNLGKYSTVWLVPAAYAALSMSSLSTDGDSPSLQFDLSVPIHVTAGYGGLRRKAQAWGIEGGLGVTASRRFSEGVFTFAPSAIVDVTYAPKNIYRLRFMTDLVSYNVEPKDASAYSMHTWTMMFVIGF